MADEHGLDFFAFLFLCYNYLHHRVVVKRRSTFQRRPPEYQILLSSIHSCAGPAVVTDDDLKDVLTAIGTCTVPPGEFRCCSTVRKGQVSGI